MSFKLKVLSAAVAGVLAVSLSGCSETTDAETASVKLSGVASKGIVKKGVVYAYPVLNGIVQPIAIANTTTDNEGKYSLSIPAYNGPISILVAPADDGGSLVTCDVSPSCITSTGTVDFGVDMPLNFNMETIVPKAQAGSQISVAITPYTTMAAQYAKKLGITEASAKLANNKIANMLGLTDLVGTLPIDITDATIVEGELNSEAIKYAILSAAIAKIAAQDANGDIGSVIAKYADQYAENSGELLGNEGTDSSTVFSLEDITNAATETVADIESKLSVSLGETTKTELTSLDTDTGSLMADQVTSTTIAVVSNADVDSAKQIVEEFRTWVTSLSDLETGANLFDSEVNMATNAGGDVLEIPLIAFGYAVEAIAIAYLEASDIGGTSFQLSDLLSLVNGDSDYFEAGYFSTPRTADSLSGEVIVNGNTVSITNGTVNGATVTLSLDLPASLNASSFSASLTSSTTATIFTSAANLSITGGSVMVNLDRVVDLASDVDPVVDPNPTFASATFNATLTQDKSAAMYPVKFEGLVNLSIDFTQDDIGTSVNPRHVVLEGAFSNMETDGSTVRNEISAKLDIYMRNSETFKRPDQPIVGSTQMLGTYLFSNDGTILTIIFEDQKITVTYDAGAVSILNDYGDNYSSENSFIIAEASLIDWLNVSSLSQVNIYSIYTEAGSYSVIKPESWLLSGGDMTGTLMYAEEVDEDESNWRDVDGTLTFAADFANIPDVLVTVSANRSGQKSGTGNATFKYNNFLVEFKGTIDEANKNNNQVSASILNLASSNKLVIYPDLESDEFYGTVSVNGNIVGSISSGITAADQDALLINYVNGEFESVTF